MNKAKLCAAVAIVLLFGIISSAQEKKAAAIKEAPPSEVGEIRLRTMAPITYVYVETETTFDKIGDAYQKAIPAVKQMGLEPSGEDREFTFYWEGFESPNNIVLIQVGVKEKAAK